MYKPVKVFPGLKQIYMFLLCESQYTFFSFFFFAIYWTTLRDYINKKTGRVKDHCQLASIQMSNYQSTVGTEIAPFFISPAFKQHCSRACWNQQWNTEEDVVLIKAVFLAGILKLNSWALPHHNNRYLATLTFAQAPSCSALMELLCSLRVIVQLQVPLCVPTIVEVSGASQDGETILLCLTMATCIRIECGFWYPFWFKNHCYRHIQWDTSSLAYMSLWFVSQCLY